ncbi:hypothetical protein [Blastococcus sp. SYSU D01042]
MLTATAGVLALVACTGAPDDVVRTSGPLAAGFEIEPGSALLGDAFPFGDDGLHVLLRVDSDLERVFEGYVEQAAELGFPVIARWADGQWCSDNPDKWSSFQGEDTPFEVECSASWFEQDDADYRSMRLRGLAEPDGSGYLEISGGRYSGTPSSRPPVEDGPVAPLTDAEIAPDLAVHEDRPPLRIVEGSELLFDPLPSECATGGWIALLRVTGDLLPVMRGYAEQIDAMRAFTTEGLVVDEEQAFVSASAAGGGDLGAVGVAGEPSYVLLSRCND